MSEGNKSVDAYMTKLAEAIDRYHKRGTPEWTDIYNRAYEAVYAALNGSNTTPHRSGVAGED